MTPSSNLDAAVSDVVIESLAGKQSETSIAVDATGQHIVIGFNDSRGFGTNPLSITGFMYSDDGGQTFVDGGQLPTPGTDVIGTTKYPQILGDPEVKYVGGSTFIYFSVMVKKLSATGTAQTLGMYRSTDNGHTWAGPFEIAPATNPHGVLSGANALDLADKEFANVDLDTGRVIVAWSNFTSTAIVPSGVEISTTYSDNVMTATPPTWSARTIVSSALGDDRAAIPRFAGHGSPNVYVAWRRGAGGFNRNIGFARSLDHGVTFTPPINIAPAPFKTMDEVPGNDRSNSSPSLAVDNSTGYVYVVYSNNNANDSADIVFQRSTNQGLSFSSPVAINSRPGADRAQWFPWVTVDSSSGRIYVFYYDQRIPFGGDLTETSVQHSDDGGVSWSKPISLTDRPFHAGYGNHTGQPNLGDYNQAVAQNGELFAVWAGTTPVGFTDGQPSANMTTPDVFFKRMPAWTSKVSLALGQVSFTEPTNGFIDPGDLVSLTLPLVNYVTNGLNASSVTAISATLSTSTPGVTVLQATRSYPNLVPGATAINASAYVVQIAPTFVAGTPIELSLAVSAAEGSTTQLFTWPTGTPLATTIFQENFNGVVPGTLPSGWTPFHAGGNNTVAWTTSSAFTGSNAAFHINANDGLSGQHTRFERLFSPQISVPADSEYVVLDFDVKYNTEDDPSFNVLAYDGFLLRIVDQTIGHTPRTLQIESFAEELTTGAVRFYPKKMPNSTDPAYLADLPAWAGISNGLQHVHLKLPGMAGTTVQLRWEYTQNSTRICTDVRSTSGPCGVAFDNIVMKNVVSVAGTQTSIVSSQSPSDAGEPVTFTATVTSNKPLTGGTVTFKEGASVLAGPSPIDASGHATFAASALAPGTHTITAEYGGTTGLAPSAGLLDQIVDPVPTFSINDVTVREGDAGVTNALFAVTLSAPTHTLTAQVDFSTADGTAMTANNDYLTTAGTLSFAPGVTIGTISVPVIGDAVFEPDETFLLNLSSAVNATIADSQGLGTIQNDDAMPAISVTDVSVVEGNAGSTSAVFTVTLSNPSQSAVTVDFGTANGTATAGSDYTAATGTLTFAPLQTSKTVTVQVNGDAVFEPDETFTMDLSGAVNATIADGQGIGTIQNDDAMPAISINDVSVAEGNVGQTPAVFTVTLSNPSQSTITVDFGTADGTATAGSDYTAATGTLTFAPLQTSKTVTVQVNGDAVFEPDETFTVDLSGAVNATIADGQGIGTIQNDDAMPAISITDVSVVEGNAGTTSAVFTVTLSNPSQRTITVDFGMANGTATAGPDYTAATGTLTFAPLQTSNTVSVPVNGDTVFEPDETFLLNLSSAVNATIADSQGLGTIQNDDAMPAISITDVSVVEGSAGTTSAVFTVTLSNPSQSTVTVDVATADGTATAESDYISAAGTFIFAPLETSKPVSVQVRGDLVIEPTETFSVNLSGAVNATIADGQGVGTIVNDDTVQSTLAALLAQVNAASGTTAGQRQALLERLYAVQRALDRARPADAIHALEQFINDVGNFSRAVPGQGHPPRLDAATAALLTPEAQSIIQTLGS